VSDHKQINLQELVTSLTQASEDEHGNVVAPAASEDMRLLIERGLHHVFLPDTLKPKAAEAFHLAFEGIGGLSRLMLWADKNPSKFFQIYARQIAATMAPVLPQQQVNVQVFPDWLTSRRLQYQEEQRIKADITGEEEDAPDT
jgi:hypothetical protein